MIGQINGEERDKFPIQKNPNLCRYSGGSLILPLPPSLECGLYLVTSFQDTFCVSR